MDCSAGLSVTTSRLRRDWFRRLSDGSSGRSVHADRRAPLAPGVPLPICVEVVVSLPLLLVVNCRWRQRPAVAVPPLVI
jgi:hypothetical protein